MLTWITLGDIIIDFRAWVTPEVIGISQMTQAFLKAQGADESTDLGIKVVHEAGRYIVVEGHLLAFALKCVHHLDSVTVEVLEERLPARRDWLK